MNSQQQKMADCNRKATELGLVGEERRDYIKTCLKKAFPPAAKNEMPTEADNTWASWMKGGSNFRRIQTGAVVVSDKGQVFKGSSESMGTMSNVRKGLAEGARELRKEGKSRSDIREFLASGKQTASNIIASRLQTPERIDLPPAAPSLPNLGTLPPQPISLKGTINSRGGRSYTEEQKSHMMRPSLMTSAQLDAAIQGSSNTNTNTASTGAAVPIIKKLDELVQRDKVGEKTDKQLIDILKAIAENTDPKKFKELDKTGNLQGIAELAASASPEQAAVGTLDAEYNEHREQKRQQEMKEEMFADKHPVLNAVKQYSKIDPTVNYVKGLYGLGKGAVQGTKWLSKKIMGGDKTENSSMSSRIGKILNPSSSSLENNQTTNNTENASTTVTLAQSSITELGNTLLQNDKEILEEEMDAKREADIEGGRKSPDGTAIDKVDAPGKEGKGGLFDKLQGVMKMFSGGLGGIFSKVLGFLKPMGSLFSGLMGAIPSIMSALGPVLAVAGAGAAGYAAGSWINEKLGLSDKLSSMFTPSSEKTLQKIESPKGSEEWVEGQKEALGNIEGYKVTQKDAELLAQKGVEVPKDKIMTPAQNKPKTADEVYQQLDDEFNKSQGIQNAEVTPIPDSKMSHMDQGITQTTNTSNELKEVKETQKMVAAATIASSANRSSNNNKTTVINGGGDKSNRGHMPSKNCDSSFQRFIDSRMIWVGG